MFDCGLILVCNPLERAFVKEVRVNHVLLVCEVHFAEIEVGIEDSFEKRMHECEMIIGQDVHFRFDFVV